MAELTFEETCEACEEAYKTYKVDTLKEARDKAYDAYFESNTAYLEARDSYHKIYRDYWDSFK